MPIRSYPLVLNRVVHIGQILTIGHFRMMRSLVSSFSAYELFKNIDSSVSERSRHSDDPSQGQGRLQLFRMFGGNVDMTITRETILAVIICNGGRLNLADANRVLRVRSDSDRVRAQLRRAADAGWVMSEGHSYWLLAESVVTDLAMLCRATAENDEAAVAHIVQYIGPPLPRVEGAWLDDRNYGSSLREELLADAVNALDEAAIKWPKNRPIVSASDALSSDCLSRRLRQWPQGL